MNWFDMSEDYDGMDLEISKEKPNLNLAGEPKGENSISGKGFDSKSDSKFENSKRWISFVHKANW